MGKEKAAGDHVDSDYSGRPVGPVTAEGVRKSARTAPPGPMIGCDLPDGKHAYYGGPGPEPGWYLKHTVNDRQVWDRPIDLDEYLNDLEN